MARALVPALAHIVLATSVAAMPPPEAAAHPSPADQQRIRVSASIGTLLHAFDRAASESSRALLARQDRPEAEGSGGHVVETTSGGRLRVTFYRGAGAEARAFFITDVENGKVAEQTWLPTPVPLTSTQNALARARETAARAAQDRGYAPCTTSPFTSVAIPSPTGAIAVYLMTAPTHGASYPMGGHFRIVIGPNGKVASSRPFTAGCLNLDVPILPGEGTPVGLVTSNRLDAVPTEIYVYASYTLRMPLYVATNDQRLWKVAGSTIELQQGP